MRIVLDMEANGLLETITKLHCISYHDIDTGEDGSVIGYAEMKELLGQQNLTIIGHNIIMYDIPAIEKILEMSLSHIRLIDTLGLSWYLYPKRLVHGLEEWGEVFGIPKPPVADWDNEPVEVYVHRCEQDVRINVALFMYQLDYLMRIYGDAAKVDRLMGYLSFKLQCAREQAETKWRLDRGKCQENLATLEELRLAKIAILEKIMPPSFEYRKAAKPKNMYKKDGSLSKHGENWMELLKENNLPEYHLGTIKVITKVKQGNPGSYAQIKAWLDSLGWQPENFSYVRPKKEDGTTDYNAEQRAIPQLSNEDKSDLCPSIKRLYSKEPKLIELEGLFIANHRIGILKGFLEHADNEDFLKAEIGGFTNTLRFQHKKPLVNLPTIPKKYWEMIRGVLIAPDDEHELCGSDMSSLEDNTGRHYMYYYDPEYVKKLMDKNYDPHLHIAVEGGLLTEEQSEEHKAYDRSKGKDGKSHKAVRLKAKKVNFGAKYGAGPPKLALTGNMPLPIAKRLHQTYWKINWSIKAIARDVTWKTVDGQMWLYNAVSGFWYSLRTEKDKFSTLNQGTGVYCFDTWIRKVRANAIRLCGQFHDEIIFPIKKGTRDRVTEILNRAIDETNAELNLNVKLGISIDFGDTYADIH